MHADDESGDGDGDGDHDAVFLTVVSDAGLLVRKNGAVVDAHD